jgi:hypothetical protein
MTATKPEIVHPLTFEEMTEAQRAYYTTRRPQVPETIHEYNPFTLYDSEVAPCHRTKR